MVRFPNASVSYNLLNLKKEFSQFIGLPQARISIDKTPCQRKMMNSSKNNPHHPINTVTSSASKDDSQPNKRTKPPGMIDKEYIYLKPEYNHIALNTFSDNVDLDSNVSTTIDSNIPTETIMNSATNIWSNKDNSRGPTGYVENTHNNQRTDISKMSVPIKIHPRITKESEPLKQEPSRNEADETSSTNLDRETNSSTADTINISKDETSTSKYLRYCINSSEHQNHKQPTIRNPGFSQSAIAPYTLSESSKYQQPAKNENLPITVNSETNTGTPMVKQVNNMKPSIIEFGQERRTSLLGDGPRPKANTTTQMNFPTFHQKKDVFNHGNIKTPRERIRIPPTQNRRRNVASFRHKVNPTRASNMNHAPTPHYTPSQSLLTFDQLPQISPGQRSTNYPYGLMEPVLSETDPSPSIDVDFLSFLGRSNAIVNLMHALLLPYMKPLPEQHLLKYRQ